MLTDNTTAVFFHRAHSRNNPTSAPEGAHRAASLPRKRQSNTTNFQKLERANWLALISFRGKTLSLTGEESRPGFACCAMRTAHTQRDASQRRAPAPPRRCCSPPAGGGGRWPYHPPWAPAGKGSKGVGAQSGHCSKGHKIVKITLFKIFKTLTRQTERTRARTHKPRPPTGYSRRALSGVTKKIPQRIEN